MHYYKHHMSDFNQATRHLSRLERSIYRDLIELYYYTEEPLTPDIGRLCRLVVAIDEQESTAVEQVLNEFFTKTPGGWFHPRCDEEIAAYHSSASAKAAAGRASAAAKAARKAEKLGNLQQQHSGCSTDVQQPLDSVEEAWQQNPTNHKPLTNNQEPIKKIAPQATPSPRRRKLPDDFILTDQRANAAMRYWSTKGRDDLNPQEQFEAFIAHHKAHGKAMADWDSAWQTWYTNAVRFSRKGDGGGGGGGGSYTDGFVAMVTDTSWADGIG